MPGGVRYATRAQLAMEERLVTQASAGTVPRLTRADAARALGADLARLEDTLVDHAQEIQDHRPERTRLTVDQAAAVLSVLTNGKRVSVINASACDSWLTHCGPRLCSLLFVPNERGILWPAKCNLPTL